MKLVHIVKSQEIDLRNSSTTARWLVKLNWLWLKIKVNNEEIKKIKLKKKKRKNKLMIKWLENDLRWDEVMTKKWWRWKVLLFNSSQESIENWLFVLQLFTVHIWSNDIDELTDNSNSQLTVCLFRFRTFW